MSSHVRLALWTFNFSISFCFLVPPPLFKVYKKVVKFSFTQQKIFWVLVFSIRIWYLAYPTDRSFISAWNNYIK